MNNFFKEFLDYNYYFNDTTIKVISDKKEKVPIQYIRIVSHINVHKVWNNKVHGSKTFSEQWQIHELQTLPGINQEISTIQ